MVNSRIVDKLTELSRSDKDVSVYLAGISSPLPWCKCVEAGDLVVLRTSSYGSRGEEIIIRTDSIVALVYNADAD
jgi:hypothetical protein